MALLEPAKAYGAEAPQGVHVALVAALVAPEYVLLGQGVGLPLPAGQKWPAPQSRRTHAAHQEPAGHVVGATEPGGHSVPR